MDLPHAFLRIANLGLLRRTARIANSVLRPPRPIAIRVDGHRVFAATPDRILALWMRKWTSAERYETQLWRDLIKPGMVVADVGGNLGVYTLLAARGAGLNGVVHSFEPDHDNHALLTRNVEANGYGNVVVHHSAVADKVGSISLFCRPEHRGDHRIYASGENVGPSVEVPVTSLDAVFADSPRLDVVKLDIQGAEGRAIAGMTEVLRANPGLKLITEFWPEGLTKAGTDPAEYLNALREHDFEIRRIDDEHEKLETMTDDALLTLCRKIRYTNLLAARNHD
jgi:FkbM family methyltransferase